MQGQSFTLPLQSLKKTMPTIQFELPDHSVPPVQVPVGALLSEAAQLAGVELGQPCGGQGRCGRCVVQVLSGAVRRRSALRLTPEDIAEGYALACQTVVEGDAQVELPQQEKIERRLTSDRVVGEVSPPAGYNPSLDLNLRRVTLRLSPPGMEDQTDDWSRLQTALRQQAGLNQVTISLSLLRTLGETLRASDPLSTGVWEVTAVLEVEFNPFSAKMITERLIALLPRRVFDDEPLWGAAVDIGTTTVSLWLVDLTTGEVKAQVAEYNAQISRGEDVISRIIYAGKPGGLEDLQQRVVGVINQLAATACKRQNLEPQEIVKLSIAGNSTMMHLLLGISPQNIRTAPFVTAANTIPALTARELGLAVCPEALVDCLPGVASYVGADITAGVYSSGMDNTEQVTLFLDVGTNGEMVMGSREWLVTCACSAGPAFEGAGVQHGMRATRGAIEEVWIAPGAFEPSYRVIGGGKARGICGSGLISLIAEMLVTGVMDKAGNIKNSLAEITPRVRQGPHGAEYILAWAAESDTGAEIVISNTDIDNLKRAKAAIYAGYTVLAESVGVPLELVEQFLIGGSFGKYINVEKAVQIGLLPDMPWERFQFLGNTAVRGAYYALLDHKARQRIAEIAARMTYIELSADNAFYEAFMSAMFLPHTNLDAFPSVAAVLTPSVPASS